MDVLRWSWDQEVRGRRRVGEGEEAGQGMEPTTSALTSADRCDSRLRSSLV